MPNTDPGFSSRLAAHLRTSSTPHAVAATALRIDSVQAFDLVARNATGGRLDHASVCRLIARSSPEAAEIVAAAEPSWALALARVTALRRSAPDPATGLALFDAVRSAHGLAVFDSESLVLYAQGAARVEPTRVPSLLAEADLPANHRWSIGLDAMNPFTDAAGPIDSWSTALSRPFLGGGVEAVTVTDSRGSSTAPFERLSARPAASVDDDALVSVVMSAYRPGPGIVAAARSVLEQSWSNLELLIVDDASPDEHAGVLKEVADLDDRVRVLTAPFNGGTYMIRNLALDHARGEFVTFQDSDDWSHPRRLELQIEALRADDRLLATRSRTFRAFPDLTFTFPGYPPDRINASSLLFRRRPVTELIGYFDTVRKSADVEYPERLQAAAPGSVYDLTDAPPLAICQLRHDSLSRGDAVPGWMHWTRVAYRDSFRARHAHVREGTATPYYDGDSANRHLPLPDPSWAVRRPTTDTRSHYDVVVLADWRRSRGARQEVIDGIRIMIDHGLHVAVAHAETLHKQPKRGNRERLSTQVQELINTGAVELTHLSRPAQADLLLVYDPAALQLVPDAGAALRPSRIAVLVDPDEAHAVGETYHLPDCDANARHLFVRRPFWVPRGLRSRDALEGRSNGADVSNVDLIRPFDASRFRVGLHRPNRFRPILGRHVPDRAHHWPTTASELLAAYPDHDDFDIRLIGGHRTPLRVLGESLLPPNWVSYDDGQMDTRTFLAQLDFFVYFHRADTTAAPEAAILEAMASGCVVVLPPHFESTYGDGALYCKPTQVGDIVSAWHRSPSDYREQQERGHAYIEQNHSPRAFLAGLLRLLDR